MLDSGLVMSPLALALDGAESAFVGREAQLTTLSRALAEERSLLVVGAPGVGKTRLVAECLERAAVEAVFVRAGGAAELSTLIARLASAIGNAGPTATTEEARARVERALERTTRPIVLDGWEALTPDADALLARWIEQTPARFIVTSRRRVAAPLDELELPPLSLDPATSDSWCEAAQLLRLRTLELARVRLGPEEREAAHRLVVALGGLPQAIELAAPSLGVLLVDQLLERVETSRLSANHDLSASIAASFSLLDADAQCCLLACAAFPGGAHLEGLEYVMQTPAEVVSGLIAARNHSLLSSIRRENELRYTLSRSVRDWLVAHAQERGQWQELEERHASYWTNHEKKGATRGEEENLRAAYETSLRTQLPAAAELALELSEPSHGLSYTGALELIQRLDQAELPQLLRARLKLKSGTLLRFLADYKSAERDLQEASELARLADDGRLEAEALVGLGCNASAQSQWERSRTLFAAAQGAGDDGSGHALTQAMVGNTYVNQDAWEIAEPLFRDSIACAVKHGDAFAEAFARLSLGVLLVERGSFDEAFGELVDAMGTIEAGRSIRLMNSRHLSAVALSHIARVRQETGDSSGALVDFHRARRIADEEGARRAEAFALCGLIGLLLELGEFRAAEDQIRVALPLIRENGHDYEGVLVALRGVYYAMQGHQGDADRLFAHAAQLLERDRRKVFAAVLDVLRGREAPLERGLESFADVRLARRLRARFFVKPPEKPLLVARDASFFRLSDQDRAVTLGRRRAVRGVLRALVDARNAQPGVALSVDDLIRAGWPGERILPSAAAGRVYTAIATLRRLGLRGVVEQNGAGYLIPAEIPLLVHEDA